MAAEGDYSSLWPQHNSEIDFQATTFRNYGRFSGFQIAVDCRQYLQLLVRMFAVNHQQSKGIFQ
jgi:hypothetical protein